MSANDSHPDSLFNHSTDSSDDEETAVFMLVTVVAKHLITETQGQMAHLGQLRKRADRLRDEVSEFGRAVDAHLIEARQVREEATRAREEATRAREAAEQDLEDWRRINQTYAQLVIDYKAMNAMVGRMLAEAKALNAEQEQHAAVPPHLKPHGRKKEISKIRRPLLPPPRRRPRVQKANAQTSSLLDTVLRLLYALCALIKSKRADQKRRETKAIELSRVAPAA